MAQNLSGGNLIGKIGSYLQIVTKDPRSTAFVPLAEAYRQIGLLDDALEAARLGTRSLPHFSPGFSTLGRVLGQMGRIDEAMGAFAKALSIDRQSQAALVGLARLHLVRGERDQARKILTEAAEFHPRDENVRNMLVALDLARPWDKLKHEQPVPSEPEPAAPRQPQAQPQTQPEAASIFTATLAEIYIKQGLTDKAIGVYREILRQGPENPAVRQRLNDLLAANDAAAQAASAPADEPGKGGAPVKPAEPVVASRPEPCQPEPRPNVLLATFERWLTGIQQRREHVH